MEKKSIFTKGLVSSSTSIVFQRGDKSKKFSGKNNYDMIVDCNFTGIDGLKVKEIPTYKTLTAAVLKAPKQSAKKFIIYIKNGTYFEKVVIDKPNISLIGENVDQTKITYNVASGTKKPDGTTYGTFNSASVSVIAPNFSVKNLTFENCFDYPKNRVKSDTDPTKLKDPQAVALKFDKGSNKAYIKNCKMTGYQDTLYCNYGTQYYTNCIIKGCIDFIFGGGQAFFNECDIISLDMKSPNLNGYITAASTNIKNKYGFVFYKCNIKAESKAMAKNSVALGRPWHPTTTFAGGIRKAHPDAVGSVVYMDCYLEAHIKTVGWDKMHGRDENGNTIYFYPEESRFYEYGSKGSGAVKKASATRKFLSKEQAKACVEKNVLNGWNPQ